MPIMTTSATMWSNHKCDLVRHHQFLKLQVKWTSILYLTVNLQYLILPEDRRILQPIQNHKAQKPTLFLMHHARMVQEDSEGQHIVRKNGPWWGGRYDSQIRNTQPGSHFYAPLWVLEDTFLGEKDIFDIVSHLVFFFSFNIFKKQILRIA